MPPHTEGSGAGDEEESPAPDNWACALATNLPSAGEGPCATGPSKGDAGGAAPSYYNSLGDSHERSSPRFTRVGGTIARDGGGTDNCGGVQGGEANSRVARSW